MFVESAKGQWTIRHGIRLPHHADIFIGEWIAGEQQIQQPYIAIIRFPFHFSAHAIDDLYLKTTLKLVLPVKKCLFPFSAFCTSFFV